MVFIRRAADAPPSAVAQALDQPATPTRATLTHGMATLTHGTDTVTGADMAKRRSMSTIIIGFLSGSFRIGIQDGGITITDTLITRITRMTIPITIIRTTATTLAETDQRASQC